MHLKSERARLLIKIERFNCIFWANKHISMYIFATNYSDNSNIHLTHAKKAFLMFKKPKYIEISIWNFYFSTIRGEHKRDWFLKSLTKFNVKQFWQPHRQMLCERWVECTGCISGKRHMYLSAFIRVLVGVVFHCAAQQMLTIQSIYLSPVHSLVLRHILIHFDRALFYEYLSQQFLMLMIYFTVGIGSVFPLWIIDTKLILRELSC